VEHVAVMGVTNDTRTLIGKFEGKGTLPKPKCKRKTIKLIFKEERVLEDLTSTCLAQDTNLVNTVMDLLVPRWTVFIITF